MSELLLHYFRTIGLTFHLYVVDQELLVISLLYPLEAKEGMCWKIQYSTQVVDAVGEICWIVLLNGD